MSWQRNAMLNYLLAEEIAQLSDGKKVHFCGIEMLDAISKADACVNVGTQRYDTTHPPLARPPCIREPSCGSKE